MRLTCLYQKRLDGDTEAIVQAYDKKDWAGHDLKVILKRRFPAKLEAEDWYKKNADQIRKVIMRLCPKR